MNTTKLEARLRKLEVVKNDFVIPSFEVAYVDHDFRHCGGYRQRNGKHTEVPATGKIIDHRS